MNIYYFLVAVLMLSLILILLLLLSMHFNISPNNKQKKYMQYIFIFIAGINLIIGIGTYISGVETWYYSILASCCAGIAYILAYTNRDKIHALK